VLDGRWRNLYRRTDPIGGPVLARDGTPGGVDTRLVDPAFAKDPDEFSWPKTRGHSDYPHDPRFAAAVGEVAGTIPKKF
jgi:hypothetical protein